MDQENYQKWVKEFREKYFKAVLSGKPEEFEKVNTEKKQVLIGKKKIYRFRPFRIHSIIDLQEGRHKLSESKDLNDPFESHYKHLSATHLRNSNLLKENRKTCYLDIKAFLEENRKEDLDSLNKFSIDENERDEAVFRYFLNFIRHTIQDKDTFICSFTLDLNYVGMWSHYADGYKGFALEYDTKELSPDTMANWFPVMYMDVKDISSEINFYLDKVLEKIGIENFLKLYKEYILKGEDNLFSIFHDDIDYIKDVILDIEKGEDDFKRIFDGFLHLIKSIKTDSWKEENEWRYFDNKIDPSFSEYPFLQIPPKALSAVHMGQNLSGDEKKLIHSTACHHYKISKENFLEWSIDYTNGSLKSKQYNPEFDENQMKLNSLLKNKGEKTAFEP